MSYSHVTSSEAEALWGLPIPLVTSHTKLPASSALTGLMMRLPLVWTLTLPCMLPTLVTGTLSLNQATERFPGVPSPSQTKLTMSPSVLFWLRGGLVITAPPVTSSSSSSTSSSTSSTTSSLSSSAQYYPSLGKNVEEENKISISIRMI